MIYLNNAATSYKKPDCVFKAIKIGLDEIPLGQMRSSTNYNPLIDECKLNLSKIIKTDDYKNIFFTSGATESFNLIINGLNLDKSHVLISPNEHNSVIRVLYNCKKNIECSILKSDKYGKIYVNQIKNQIKSNTKAIFVNHCSNVTGIIQDLEEIGKIAKENNLIFIVDSSQSLGCIEMDVELFNIDILVFTSHKSLYGISGLGGFYLKTDIKLEKTKFGGSGIKSNEILQDKYNNQFEVGTQNFLGIAALKSSCDFLLQIGLKNIYRDEKEKINYLYNKLKIINKVIVYTAQSYEKGPLLSFNIIGLDSNDLSYILTNSYQIIVRNGLHCAPFIHDLLKTSPKGSIRVSISYFTTYEELDYFINAVEDIVNSL